MKDNNIIISLLFAIFPGLMKLVSFFPRHYYMIIIIVAIIVMSAFYLFRKSKKDCLYCVPIIVVSFMIWMSYSSVSNKSQIDYSKILFYEDNTPSQELFEKADAGDINAQIQLATSLLKTENSEKGYIITTFNDLSSVAYYANLAAEQGSAKGYVISGICKLAGWGVPKMKNSAIQDFQRAIELDPLCEDAYVNMLKIESIMETHPEAYNDCLDAYNGLLRSKMLDKQEFIDTLNYFVLTRSETNNMFKSYLHENDSTICAIISDDVVVLERFLKTLLFTGNHDLMKRYKCYFDNNRDLIEIAFYSYINEWSISQHSTRTDSLVKMLPLSLLKTYTTKQDSGFDVYLNSMINNEYAFQKYRKGEYDKKQFDSIKNHSETIVKAYVNNLKQSVLRETYKLEDKKDSIYAPVWGFEFELEYQ